MQEEGDVNAGLAASSSPAAQPNGGNPQSSSRCAGPRTAKTYTRAEWDVQKEVIRLHYCVHGKKLHEVVEVFRKVGFFATEKQFKDRIRLWGFDKKIKMKWMKAIIRKRNLRRQQGKESRFEVRGRPVDEANINRASARYGSSQGSNCSPEPSSPPEVFCYTPPQESSPLSSAVQVVCPIEHESIPSLDDPPHELAPKHYPPQSQAIPAPPEIQSYPIIDSSSFFVVPNSEESWPSKPYPDSTGLHTPYADHIDPRFLQNDTSWSDIEPDNFEQVENFSVPLLKIDSLESTSGESFFSTASNLSEYQPPNQPQRTPRSPASPISKQSNNLRFPSASDFSRSPIPSPTPNTPPAPAPPSKRFKEDLEDELSQKFDEFHTSRGIHHAETINALDDLTVVLKAQGRYLSAEQLSKQVEEASKITFGTNSRESLLAACSRLDALACQGLYKSAQARELLDRAVLLLGPEDYATISIKSLLSKIHYAVGSYCLAESLAAQVFHSEVRRLGPSHADTLAAKAFWGVTLLSTNRADEGERLIKLVMSDYQPKDEMLVLDRKGDLAYAYAVQRRFRESEELEREVLKGQTALLGSEHPNTLKTVVRLARTLRLQRKYDDAKELLVDVLDRQKRVLSAWSQELLVSIEELGCCLRLQRSDEFSKAYHTY